MSVTQCRQGIDGEQRLTTSELQADTRGSLFDYLCARGQVLASAVSKLYLCPASLGEYRWTGVWGALALVVDRSPPLSKHIQMYDMHTWTRLLNVQLYQSMVYLEPNHLFHTFEIEVG